MKKFLSCAVGLAIAVACLGCGTTGVRSPVVAEANEANGIKWDEGSSRELTQLLHHMHQVWNEGDIQSLKDLLVGDDKLVTFELDPHTDKPVQLRSKAEVDRFVEAIVAEIKTRNAKSFLEMPLLHCRATKSFGICTEECTTHLTTPDGVDHVDHLWSTNVAIKQAGRWKWVQWHMSVARPREERAAKVLSQR